MHRIKKSFYLAIFTTLVLLITTIALPSNIVLAKSIYEKYDSVTEQGFDSVYNTRTVAQTFTATSNHAITSVSLLLKRLDSTTGEVKVAIRATSGGAPSGGDLASGTTDGNTIPSGSSQWREIPLSTCIEVTKDTVYAIVLTNTGDIGHRVGWQGDTSSTDYYTGGSRFYCCWSPHPVLADSHFIIYGEEQCPAPPTTPTPTPGGTVGGDVFAVNKTSLIAPWIALAAIIIFGSVYLIRRRVYG